MLNQPVGSLADIAKVVEASRSASVSDAASRMLVHGVSAVLVIEDGHLRGILTEHDIVTRVIGPGLDPNAVRVGDVMTPEPLTIGPEELFGHALVVMQEHGIRHLPVVRDGAPIGIVCARDALDPALEDFVAEQRRRESFR